MMQSAGQADEREIPASFPFTTVALLGGTGSLWYIHLSNYLQQRRAKNAIISSTRRSNKQAPSMCHHAQGSDHITTCQRGRAMDDDQLSISFVSMKRCSKCGVEKSAQDFHRSNSTKNGLQSWCKPCARASRVTRQIKHREERAMLVPQYPAGMKLCSQCGMIKFYAEFPVSKLSRDGHVSNCHTCRKMYYELNKERISAWKKQDRIDNLEERRAKDREYTKEHRNEKIIYLRTWKQTHPEYATQYYYKNPEKFQEKNAKRRARRAQAPINDFTQEQWEFLLQQFRHRCAYCGKKSKHLTRDHITPLAKGGSHTLSNIVPACQRCNSAKRDRDPLVPVQPFFLIAQEER